MENTLSPQGMNAIRLSLGKLTQVCDALIAVLDRSPETVSHYTGSSAYKFQSSNDGDGLHVDVITRGLNIMDRHLDNIIKALATHTLYDGNYRAGQSDTATLVEALQYKRDTLAKKRASNGFLNQTFGRRFEELTKKIDKIYHKIPLYTQKAA
jgi:hypothetical protein